MIGCECCGADLAQPVISTIAGEFMPPWGLCRACWRFVPRVYRRTLRQARLEYRLSPFMAQAALYQRAWQACLTEALAAYGWRESA
jgi:hypothetical protein